MTIGCLILAGGKSSRMGREKAFLSYHGMTFLDKLILEFSDFREILVSVDKRENHPEIPYPMVEDIYPDAGPMGGIYSALSRCRSDALLVIPCDVPLFSQSLFDRLMESWEKGTDAVILVTEDGRKHPLCGIYHKSCLSVLKTCLERKERKMMLALKQLHVTYLQAGEDSWRLRNINTPGDYRTLSECCFLAVSGYKNAGKTTLIERLIPELTKAGVRVATVKHDGHSFEPDVPGTDSHRFFQAGACASMVYDGEKYAVVKREPVTEEVLRKFAPEADLLLLEGFKHSDYPKLELIRQETHGKLMDFLKGRIAYVADMHLEGMDENIPVFHPDDVSSIASFIIEQIRNGKLTYEH